MKGDFSNQLGEVVVTSFKKKILVVDDEPDIVEFLTQLLEMNGFDVIGTLDGADVLDLSLSHSPDLIILDMMLPNKDGWAVQDDLKSNADTSQIPIIVLTAKDLTITKMINKEVYGVSEFIAKPFNPSFLLEKIREILAMA